MNASKNSPFAILAACLGLAGLITLIAVTAASTGLSSASAQGGFAPVSPEGYAQVSLTTAVTPTVTPTPAAMLYMPWINDNWIPEVKLLKFWASETVGGKIQSVRPNGQMYYQVVGVNTLLSPVDVGLTWEQVGSCSSELIISDTLTLQPGIWSYNFLHPSPLCSGVFKAKVNMTYEIIKNSLETSFVVNLPGTVQVNIQQGFDKCSHPDLDDMQVWWDKSPYVVFNLYLGGISYACKNSVLDKVYVSELAEQGWWFIPTWVGPQAPCSKYTHKMSANRDEAYDQGWGEAVQAVQEAEKLDLFGQKIIYYDLEAYTGDDKCRNTVKAFIRGWTESLHAQGHKAGGYGASCRSYIEDWAQNTPPPDDIWIAHWISDGYDPSATVWDAVCLDDPTMYWLNHQRLRQYAGGHAEPWGGVTLTIDSNVLDGEVFDLAVAGSSSQAAPNEVINETTGAELRDVGLVDSQRGWLLREAEDLLWTSDGGDSWQRVTPPIFTNGRILGIDFKDAGEGWVIGLPAGRGELWAARTPDGGGTWAVHQLPLSPNEVLEVAGASLEVLQSGQVYAALELQSGSSFSLGRLFTSLNGGVSWEERSIPLGEPVAFQDGMRGWTAGGAAGDQLYRTTDGGFTWQEQALELPDAVQVEISLPRFDGKGRGWLPLKKVDGAEDASVVFITQDGGMSWEKFSPSAHSQYFEMDITPDLMTGTGFSTGSGYSDGTIRTAGIPEGMVWAITQEGSCAGDKQGQDGVPVVCTRSWSLLRSMDGGAGWGEITPSG